MVSRYDVTVYILAVVILMVGHVQSDCQIPDFQQYNFQPFRRQSLSTFKPGRRLFMKCKDAYVKESGSNWIKCKRGGNWEGLGDLVCKLRTCTISDNNDFDNGNVHIAGDFTVGTIATFECNNGYTINTMNGSPRRLCMADGNLDDVLPQCQPKPCAKPEIHEQMYVSLNIADRWDFHHGDSVHVTCAQGFYISGTRHNNEYIQCLNAAWSREFQCEQVTCNEPDILDGYIVGTDGQRRDRSWPVESIARVRCNEGASLGGEDGSMFCSTDGHWDQVPQCKRVCTGDNIDNGYLRRNIQNGGMGHYYCDDGYSRGTGTGVKCINSVLFAKPIRGSWWDNDYTETPVCNPDPTRVYSKPGTEYTDNNGRKYASRYSEVVEHGTTLQMTCRPGYVFPEEFSDRDPVLITTYLGQWKYNVNGEENIVESQPECDEAPCEVPNNDKTFYSNANYGVVESGHYTYVSCESRDYEVMPASSTDRMRCDKGQWDKTLTCEPKRCYFSNPESIMLRRNDLAIRQGYKEHEFILSIKCEDGYHFGPDIESVKVTCHYGQWQDSNGYEVNPTCVAKPCEVPTDVQTVYSNVNSGVVESGQYTTVSCKTAYYEVTAGQSTRSMRCDKGQWKMGGDNTPPLICQLKQCKLTNPESRILQTNGMAVNEGYKKHGFSQSIKCEDGYQFGPNIGTMYITCHNGQWKKGRDIVTPTCQEKPCPVPGNINTVYKRNGSPVSEVASGQTVEISCSDSDRYEVDPGVDSGTITCDKGRREIVKTCSPKSCKVPKKRGTEYRVNGGLIQDQYQYHGSNGVIRCQDGYLLPTDRQRVSVACQYGQWLDNQGGVVDTFCTQLRSCHVEPVSNGFYNNISITRGTEIPHNDEIMMQCDSGYKTEWNYRFLIAVCDDGNWMYKLRKEKQVHQFKCYPESCSVDTLVGAVTYYDGDEEVKPNSHATFGWNTLVSYSCGGQDLVNTTCNQGEWNPPVTCETCSIDTVKGVKYYDSKGQISPDDHYSFGVNMSISYKCGNKKSVKITCNEGEWNPSINCAPLNGQADHDSSPGSNDVENNDPCLKSPCQNGGICRRDNRGYKCQCNETYFYGTHCEIEVAIRDPCLSTPCLNGGTCIPDGDGGYKCQCDPNDYFGINCQERVSTQALCNRTILDTEIELYGYGDSVPVNNQRLTRNKYFYRKCPDDLYRYAFYIMCNSYPRLDQRNNC